MIIFKGIALILSFILILSMFNTLEMDFKGIKGTLMVLVLELFINVLFILS